MNEAKKQNYSIERLKELRIKHKLTQAELADKLGVSRSCLSHYESGHRAIGLDKLLMLCQIYQVRLDELLAVDYQRADLSLKVSDKLDEDEAK